MVSHQKSDSRQSTRIYLKNKSAKFHPGPIWNDVALRFFEERRPQQTQEPIEEQQDEFLIQKYFTDAETQRSSDRLQ